MRRADSCARASGSVTRQGQSARRPWATWTAMAWRTSLSPSTLRTKSRRTASPRAPRRSHPRSASHACSRKTQSSSLRLTPIATRTASATWWGRPEIRAAWSSARARRAAARVAARVATTLVATLDGRVCCVCIPVHLDKSPAGWGYAHLNGNAHILVECGGVVVVGGAGSGGQTRGVDILVWGVFQSDGKGGSHQSQSQSPDHNQLSIEDHTHSLLRSTEGTRI